jgi:hypothetical protein
MPYLKAESLIRVLRTKPVDVQNRNRILAASRIAPSRASSSRFRAPRQEIPNEPISWPNSNKTQPLVTTPNKPILPLNTTLPCPVPPLQLRRRRDSHRADAGFKLASFFNSDPEPWPRPPASGIWPPATRIRPPATGHRPPVSGPRPLASSHRPPATGIWPPATRIQPPATGHRPPATGIWPPATRIRPQPPATGHRYRLPHPPA